MFALKYSFCLLMLIKMLSAVFSCGVVDYCNNLIRTMITELTKMTITVQLNHAACCSGSSSLVIASTVRICLISNSLPSASKQQEECLRQKCPNAPFFFQTTILNSVEISQCQKSYHCLIQNHTNKQASAPQLSTSQQSLKQRSTLTVIRMLVLSPHQCDNHLPLPATSSKQSNN